MLGLRCLFCGVVFVCAAACSEAVAAETGRIEVEVVYKDTGEPVERALVRLVDVRGRYITVLQEAATSAEGTYRFEDVAFGDHEVHLTNPDIRRGELDRFPSSKFIYDDVTCIRGITLSAANPTVQAGLKVERGWYLSGTITRGDGSPLTHVIVEARRQSDSIRDVVRALTDEKGRYKLFGLRAGELTRVYVQSTSWSDDLEKPVWYEGARLWEGELEPRQESTRLDVQVPIASLEVEFAVTRAVWPFATRGYLTGTISSRTFRLSDVPRDRGARRMVFDQLPADTPVTVFIGLLTDVKATTPPGRASPREWSILEEQELSLHEGSQKLRLEYIEPRAVLSRVVWFGVLAVVLAVCITALVLHARELRRREGAG